MPQSSLVESRDVGSLSEPQVDEANEHCDHGNNDEKRDEPLQTSCVFFTHIRVTDCQKGADADFEEHDVKETDKDVAQDRSEWLSPPLRASLLVPEEYFTHNQVFQLANGPYHDNCET